MAYEWNQIEIEEITNLYLYGGVVTPPNLASESVIRGPDKRTVIQVNTASFMESGSGRFALGGQSALMDAFFSKTIDFSWVEPGRE